MNMNYDAGHVAVIGIGAPDSLPAFADPQRHQDRGEPSSGLQ